MVDTPQPSQPAQPAQPSLAQVLRQALHDSGYETQAALAVAAGMDVGQLNKMLSGETRQPRVETLSRLAGPLGVPLATLAVAAGYPREMIAATPPLGDPRLREMLALLEEDPEFMAQFRAAQPLDEGALRDVAAILLPYFRAIQRGRGPDQRRRSARGSDPE